MTQISVVYYGGEQDGFQEKLDVDSYPELLYLWRNTEDRRMAKAKGDARRILADKLGVLAYKFAGARKATNGKEFLYVRWPQADKKLTSKG